MKLLALGILCIVGWTALLYRWAEDRQLFVPDDPSDGGAVLAAQAYVWMTTAIWLGGVLVIAVILLTLWRHARERGRQSRDI